MNPSLVLVFSLFPSSKALTEHVHFLLLSLNTVIATSDSGREGISGSLSLSTGTSTQGNSGEINIRTGDANAYNNLNTGGKTGGGGNITMAVGSANYGRGGHMKFTAGSTTGFARYNIWNPIDVTGGEIEMTSGSSKESDSGHIEIATASAGTRGVSGYLNLQTGDASSGDAGTISKS